MAAMSSGSSRANEPVNEPASRLCLTRNRFFVVSPDAHDRDVGPRGDRAPELTFPLKRLSRRAMNDRCLARMMTWVQPDPEHRAADN